MNAQRLKRTLTLCLAVSMLASLSLIGSSCKGNEQSATSHTGESQSSSSGTENAEGTESNPSGDNGTTETNSTTVEGNNPGGPLRPGTTPNNNGNDGTTTNKKNGDSQGTTTAPPKDKYNPYPRKSELKGKTIKVLLWYPPQPNEEAIIKKFEKTFDAKVNVIVTSWADYMTRLSLLISGKDTPDVVCMTPDRFPLMFISNQVEPISKGHFDLKNDKIYDITQMDQFKWNGQHMGVNLKGANQGCDYSIIMFNKRIFKGSKHNPYDLWKSGKWNWDTFLEAARSVTNKSANKYGFGAADKSLWMLSAGTDFIRLETKNNKTKIINNLDDPKLVTAFTFYNDLRKKYEVDPSDADSVGDFFSGKVAMYADWQYQMAKGSEVDQKMTDDWGVVPFPSPKSGSNAIIATKSRLWCIGIGTKNTLPASYFIRYFIDPANGSGDKLWWAKPEFLEVFVAMTNMKKFSNISEGVVGYNDHNDYFDLQSVAYADRDQISNDLKARKPKLDNIIKDVESKIPQR